MQIVLNLHKMSNDLQKYLGQYYRLGEKKKAGRISEKEFRKRESEISRKIKRLVDREITLLEKEKDTLVFRLSDLEDSHKEKIIDEEQYDTGHTEIRERLLDIDSQLLKLRTGKADIRELEYERPQVVILRKHAVLFVLFVFIICVAYMSSKGWIDVKAVRDSVIYHLKKFFVFGEGTLSRKRATFFSNVNTSAGFSVVRPQAIGTVSSEGALEVAFFKPPFQIEIMGVRASNAITNELCDGAALVNGKDAHKTQVVLPMESKSFTILITGCPDIDPSENYTKIKVTIDYDTILGDVKTNHVSMGEITFIKRD